MLDLDIIILNCIITSKTSRNLFINEVLINNQFLTKQIIKDRDLYHLINYYFEGNTYMYINNGGNRKQIKKQEINFINEFFRRYKLELDE